MIMNNNYSENIFKKCLLDNIHYSFYNIHEFISGKDFIDKMYNPCNNLNLEIYSTFLFINLHGLITDLKVSDNNKINAIIKYQKIKSYKRYKRNKEIEINSIDKVIEHYRDAVCHVESHNNKITDSFDGNNFKLLISGIGNEPKISYGGGSLSINDNLIPLIKEIKKIFIPNKIRVISIYGRENRLLFCDVLNHDDNFPIVGKVEINKLTNDMFRFNFPFIK